MRIEASYKSGVKKTLVYLLLILFSLIFILPFLQLLSTSLKSYWETQQIPPSILPSVPQWNNYVDIWSKTSLPVFRWFLNTVFTTSMIVLGIVLSCSYIAFGFARFNGKGRNFWFYAIMCTMFIPIYAKIIPLFMIFKGLGWNNTFLTLIVEPFFGSAMYMFLFRQFIMTVPKDMDEAALIDGAGYFRIFFKIILPIIKPAVAAVAVLAFVAAWGDFFTPMIFLKSQDKFTISIGLSLFNSTMSTGRANRHWIAAMTVVASLPSFIIFFSAQKYFVGGLTTGAIKG